MSVTDNDMLIERFELGRDGAIPNNPRLPVLIYHGVIGRGGDPARSFERLFRRNGWTNSWRDGMYGFHHFHSTAHEVLGIAGGWVRARIGGTGGHVFDLGTGDVVLLPAGTGHKCESASVDLLIVGAYAEGREWDLRRGAPEEWDEVLENIRLLPDPERDPVTGGPFKE